MSASDPHERVVRAIDDAEIFDGAPLDDDDVDDAAPEPVRDDDAVSDAPPRDAKATDDREESRKLDASDRGYDVEKLNREYALVLMGSKAVVVREQPTAFVEDRVRILSIEAFGAYFTNRRTEVLTAAGKISVVTWAKRWMSDRKRRTFDGIEFHPDPKDAPGHPRYLNLWRGFSVTPRAGAGSYAIFRDHLLTNVCGGNEALFRWLFGWFAHLVQKPRERVGTALVFKGKMGTGKSKIGEIFGSLMDAHFFLVDEPRYITGQFNAHMAACLLLQAEEAVWAGDKAAEGRLKSLITSKIQMIEAKGIDPIRVLNYVRLIMTSNEDWVIPAGLDERRFAVFEVSDYVKENFAYFKAMDAELDAGGREALLADLLAFDLSKVELRSIPRTDALLEQKVRSMGHVEQWFYECLLAGVILRGDETWRETVPIGKAITAYLERSEKIGVKRRAGEVEMGLTMARLVPGLKRKRVTLMEDGGKQVRTWCWIMPPLAVCRYAFDELMQQKCPWPKPDDEPNDAHRDGRETGMEDGF